MSRGGSRPPTPAEVYAVQGGHPHGPSNRLLAEVDLALLGTMAAAAGLDAEVHRFLVALEGDPTHQVLARVVRRTGKRWEEVAETYSDTDLAFELAQEILDARDRVDRCPDCGTKPEDTLDPEQFRPLEHGRWKWALHTCGFCQRGKIADRRLNDEDREAGARFRIEPRGWGEPDIDMGDTEE